MTPKERAAMQQALEALKDAEKYGKVYFPGAITALREALAEQAEQEPVAEIIGFEFTQDIRGIKQIPRIQWNVSLWEDESPLQLGNLYTSPVRTNEFDVSRGRQCAEEMRQIAKAAIAKATGEPK